MGAESAPTFSIWGRKAPPYIGICMTSDKLKSNEAERRCEGMEKRKFHLVLYGLAIPISLFALYTFIFVFDNGIGWKIALIIIGLGWLISAISGFITNLKK